MEYVLSLKNMIYKPSSTALYLKLKNWLVIWIASKIIRLLQCCFGKIVEYLEIGRIVYQQIENFHVSNPLVFI